jgi:hypothetical protein
MATTISDSAPRALATAALTPLLDAPEAYRVRVAPAFLLGARLRLARAADLQWHRWQRPRRRP